MFNLIYQVTKEGRNPIYNYPFTRNVHVIQKPVNLLQNQLTGFYMIRTLVVNKLRVKYWEAYLTHELPMFHIT